MPAKNIVIKGRDSARDDGEAGGTITPGDLIEQTGVSGNERTYARHATAAAKTSVSIALEGKGGRGIDQDYASGEYMEYKDFLPGDEFYGFVFAGATASGTAPDVSANATLTAGDLVVSYGNGKFRLFDSANDTQGAVLARATEAVDNSGGSEPARVVFEVL